MDIAIDKKGIDRPPMLGNNFDFRHTPRVTDTRCGTLHAILNVISQNIVDFEVLYLFIHSPIYNHNRAIRTLTDATYGFD